MAPALTQLAHHHRSTTKTTQKTFKSRHATKSTLKEKQKGKVDSHSLFERGVRKTPHQQVMSRLDRKNHAKQLRENKNAAHAKAASVFQGSNAAPRIVAVVPLCEGIDCKAAIKGFAESVDVTDDVEATDDITRVYVERFKQTMAFVPVHRDVLAALDLCKIADYVVFVLSATEEVDDLGEVTLRAIESQGVSNTLVVAQGIDTIEPAKKRPQILASLKSYISHFLPATEKVNSLDARQECLNVVRSICTSIPKGIRWREDRSWIMVEETRWSGGKAAVTEDDATGEVVLTGVVRGKGLKADRLLQVADWGSYQIDKIVAAPLETRRKVKAGTMAVDQEGQGGVLEEPSQDQDDLIDLAPEEVLMEEEGDDMAMSIATSSRRGVLVDDHHYYSDEETRLPENLPKKLPRGTSKYQAAWYLDNISDSGSDMESVDERMFAEEREEYGPADGEMGDMDMGDGMTEGGPSEYPQSEMFLDPSPEDEADAIEAYRKARKDEADDDLEFPDEIELHPGVLARERLTRYRGLKSLRTSVWDTEEDRIHEPAEWRRLLEINNYKGARNRVLNETLIGGVKPGTRVSIHLRAVPLRHQQQDSQPSTPLAAFSLLRHEQKRAAVNMAITLSADEVTSPIKSKSEIIVQCGPRRFVTNPLFSSAGNTPNDVHKFARYLHPGQTAIATFIAPITWGSVPILYFQRSENTTSGLKFIGTGTSLPPSQSRVIAKRIILTGSPFKINKRLVTIRYMFFNTEDVAWFKALQLWTKRGRSGYIKESLGTHGYFKATFDGKINPMDSVAVSLYKRVWPRQAAVWDPSVVQHGEEWNGIEGEEVPDLVMS